MSPEPRATFRLVTNTNSLPSGVRDRLRVHIPGTEVDGPAGIDDQE